MSEWKLDKGEWRDSNPYGKRISDHILEYPEWGIYLRRDTRFKCPEHYSEVTESYKSFGQVDHWCMGLGVAVSGSIVPCSMSRGRNAEIGPLAGTVKDFPGYMDMFHDVAHFPREVLPQINDLLLLCEWNVPAQKIDKFTKARPIRVHSIYIIRQINSYFKRELSHFSCGVESLDINVYVVSQLVQSKLTNLPVINVEKTWRQNSYWSA